MSTRASSSLLPKWQLLGRALADSGLSAADCAVLHKLCDYYDVDRGEAYPSQNRLAKDTGRDRRTVQRSLVNLEARGFIETVRHGDRTTTNGYRPLLDAPRVAASTPLGVAAPVPLGVAASTPKGSGVDVARVAAPTPLKPTYEPGYEPGFSVGSPDAGASGAVPGASPEAPPGPATAGRRYPQFWDAYPKATGVYVAEQRIDALLAEGVPLAQLVAAAKGYASHVAAQKWQDKDRFTAGADNWLRDRRWLDDHSKRAGAKATGRQSRAAGRSDFGSKNYEEEPVHARKRA